MGKTRGLIIPVFNEEATLNDVVEVIVSKPGMSEIVFVDDGSTDKTGDILKSWLSKGHVNIKVVQHQKNKGKGAAIQSALKVASSDFIFIQDADLEYDPAELDNLYPPLEKAEADVVFGSRFLTPNPNLYWTYLMGNKILTKYINVLSGGRLTDSYTCYKGMSLKAWRALNLKSNGFEIEAEITMKCLLAKWRIKEVPVKYNPRTFESGKKIRSTDALYGMLTALKFWFFRSSPKKDALK